MPEKIKVAELFAGVGGFRLGLDGYHSDERPEWDLPAAGPFETVWANQWEPPGTKTRQFAARCYEERFGEGSVVNEDIHEVLEAVDAGKRDVPDVDMVVGGFPCQDYSVARTLADAKGIEGKKGVLWWDIYNFLEIQISKSPNNARYCLFENVDRLLKSPARQRGRDFAIILSCLARLGYSVEWRVVNSGEYGFPQRRKRTYIYAVRNAGTWDLEERVRTGVMASAFPMEDPTEYGGLDIPEDPYSITLHFNDGGRVSPFRDCGAMQGYRVATAKVTEAYEERPGRLADVLVPEGEVPEQFYVDGASLPRWTYLKGAKHEPRVARNGHEYMYSEGAMSFPDSLEKPSRTILTGEGGTSPSRFKHVIEVNGRLRRLVPDELDQLQGFPRGWTSGMTDGHRAFCMGNALVVGIPHRIGVEIAHRIESGD